MCYLGDLEGVPSGLLGSISLCSCFCRAILSAACLHDKKQSNVSKADTSEPEKNTITMRVTYSLSCLVSLTTCEAKDMQVSTTTRYRAQVVCPCLSALWEGRSPCWFWIVTLEPYSTRVWIALQRRKILPVWIPAAIREASQELNQIYYCTFHTQWKECISLLVIQCKIDHLFSQYVDCRSGWPRGNRPNW